MKIACGIDIIEIDRIKENIDKLENKFLDKIFTQKEIQYCEGKKKQKYQHYAARFAAKEACFKAISKSLKSKYDITWQDIEVENDKNGKPQLHIKKVDTNLIENIDISISHCKQYAIANVVVLYK